MSAETKITVADLRAVGICKDAKRLFFEPNGLDWRDFVKNGITPSAARAAGGNDPRIDDLEAAAIKRVERNGRR